MNYESVLYYKQQSIQSGTSTSTTTTSTTDTTPTSPVTPADGAAAAAASSPLVDQTDSSPPASPGVGKHLEGDVGFGEGEAQTGAALGAGEGDTAGAEASPPSTRHQPQVRT